MARFKRVQSYKVKQAIFLLVLLFLIAAAYVLLTIRVEISVLGALAIIGAVLILLVLQYDFLLTLKEYERAVIFRFGRVVRVGGPGWAFVLPVIESFRFVDLRTQTIDIPEQEVITADRVVVTVDAVIYLYVKPDKQSVINSVIEIEDYRHAAELFVDASIRDAAGSLTLQELISKIGELNARVQNELIKIASAWGVEVEAVQITDIRIPKELEQAMTEQKAAEQKRLIRTELAEAHKVEIEAVREAAEHLSDKALAYYYIRALEKIAEGRSTKLVFPLELVRLAERIGQPTYSSSGQLDQLFAQYAPAIKKFVENTDAPKLPAAQPASYELHAGAPENLRRKKILKK